MQKQFKHTAEIVRNGRTSNTSLSQSALSEMIGYKNGQFISNIERGLCGVPARKVAEICKLISVTEDQLIMAMTRDFVEHVRQECDKGRSVVRPKKDVFVELY